tara:strand:+ start:499 stop:1050 length:552 start_codon:yes stop_codon:yes gene_type:complete
MKKFLFLFSLLALSLSCNSSDDDISTDDDPQQEELGDAEASFTVQGPMLGTVTVMIDDFDGTPFGERLQIELEQTDEYSIDIQLLNEGGYEPGTIKTLTVSSDTYTNEISFIVKSFNNNSNEFYDSTTGTVTITDNVPYELFGGQGIGIALSGNIEARAVHSETGEEITITGSFSNVRILLDG